MKKLKGIGVSDRIAIAPAYVVYRPELAIARQRIVPDEVENEKKRFQDAVARAKEQIVRVKSAVAKNMGSDHAAMIDSQIMFLKDNYVLGETAKLIEKEKINAEFAFQQVMNTLLEQAQQSGDAFFIERVQEFQDVKRRVISQLLGNLHTSFRQCREPRILVIDHLSPSETAQLLNSNIVGIVTEVGGETSHIAIMANTMEIPAVLGIENATKLINPLEKVIVNGEDGKVIASPSASLLDKYLHRIEHIDERWRMLHSEVDKPAVTLDGHKITVAANIELPDELKLMQKYGANGIGLFRTELLYTMRKDFPPEELQAALYSRIAKECPDEKVIIRTFDVGGDKFADIFGHRLEPNPFLGWRAIRIGLEYPHILSAQIKAIIRASAYGNVSLMFPMVTALQEIISLRKLIDKAKEELLKENIPFDENMELGIMVEVPSAAILAKTFAKYVDFMSIGTNDLIQYTLAVDRGNQQVSYLYEAFNPAVLQLIQRTIDGGHDQGIWVGMCGEMAGKAIATPLLLGLGLDELSMHPSHLPLIRGIIRRIKLTDAKTIAQKAVNLTTHRNVVKYLKHSLEELLPEDFWETIH